MDMKLYFFFSPQNGDCKGAVTDSVLLTKQLERKELGVACNKPVSQAPLINDSLISEDHEGFPHISAVFSLAMNSEKYKSGSNAVAEQPSSGSAFIGGKVDLPSSVTLQTIGFPVDNNDSYVISGNSLSTKRPTIGHSSTVNPKSHSLPNEKRNIVSKGVTGTDNSVCQTPSSVTMSAGQELKPVSIAKVPVTSSSKDSASVIITSVASAMTQTPGSVSQLVRLVQSVPVSSTPSGTVVNATQSVVSSSKSTVSYITPVAQAPKQIIIKQDGLVPGESPTSLVLNLLPGEPIPKAIYLQGSDGKPATIVRITEGASVAQSGKCRRIVIPVPVSISSSPVSSSSKQIYIVNKMASSTSGHIPIAPHSLKPNPTAPLGITSVFVPISSSSVSQVPVGMSRVSSSAAISSVNTTIPAVSPSSSSVTNCLGNSVVSAARATAVASAPRASPSEQTASSSGSTIATGLSPHDAKIQRLKELLKQQEDAVDKLREKKRIEIERVRDQSVASNNADTVIHERMPLTEQKRPSSPFAVPLPPKKTKLDVGSKTKTAKPLDSNAPQAGRAFIPNGDDKTFVQLVGLENVVSTMK